MRWNVIPVAVVWDESASVSRGWKSHSGLLVVRFVWSGTRGAKFRRILVNGRSAPRYTARIRLVITLYVYGGDPFVGPLLSVHHVIYRGKPTYRAAPRHHHRALTHPVLPAATRISKARVALALSAGSFTTSEFVTNSGASAPDVYYLAEAFRRTSKAHSSLHLYMLFSQYRYTRLMQRDLVTFENVRNVFSYEHFHIVNGIIASRSNNRWYKAIIKQKQKSKFYII